MKVQPKVYRAEGMREGSNRDQIDAGRSSILQGSKTDVTTGLKQDVTSFHGSRLPHLVKIHVVEEDDVHAAKLDESCNLLEVVCFNFNAHIRIVCLN